MPAKDTAPKKGTESKPNILIIWGDDIGCSTVLLTTTASWATARPTSTASPKKV